MMFWEALSAARDLGRLHDIASILIRYGFGDMVRRLGMSSALEAAGKVLKWREPVELATMEPPERVRRALEDLGPTFVKLGQILATRVDLFSPEWISEFEKLQDRAPEVTFSEIKQQLREDLGTEPEEVFAWFDPQPLAAASLGQVHRARLADDSEVIVKVRRPGIRPIIEADLRLMSRLAKIIEQESPDWRHFRPLEVVRQFTLSLRRELDLAAESRNAERVAKNFANHPEIVIPKVYWEWTSERLNVQEYIKGIPARDLGALDKAGLDRKILARRGAQAVLKMILEDGFFHADPHQGNVFYLQENRVAFIDFGMVGRLSDQRRHQVVELLHGLVEQDTGQVVEVLLDWAGTTQEAQESLTLEIDTFIDQYHGVALNQINFGDMLGDLAAILRDHKLTLPPDLSLFTKAFITLEGLGRELDPEYDMVGETSPFLRRAMINYYKPGALVKRGKHGLINLVDMLSGLPQDLRQLLRSARSGKVQMQVDVRHLQHFGDQLDRGVSRLTVGIVTAALIIGSSIVMTVRGGPTLMGLPLFGLLGFIGATVGGIWLMLSIWRGGRR